MRISFAKTALICLLFCAAAILWLGVRAQVIESREETDPTDTSESITNDFPFEAEEISISEGRIYVRTSSTVRIPITRIMILVSGLRLVCSWSFSPTKRQTPV